MDNKKRALKMLSRLFESSQYLSKKSVDVAHAWLLYFHEQSGTATSSIDWKMATSYQLFIKLVKDLRAFTNSFRETEKKKLNRSSSNYRF